MNTAKHRHKVANNIGGGGVAKSTMCIRNFPYGVKLERRED
jgi:hypothetical protein